MPLPRTRRTQRHHDRVELLQHNETPNVDAPTEVTHTWDSYDPPRIEYWTVQPGSRSDAAATDRARIAGLVTFITPKSSLHATVGQRFRWQGDEYEVDTMTGLQRGQPAGIAQLVST